MLAGALALVAVPRLLPRRGKLRDLVRLRTELEQRFATNLFGAKAMARHQGRIALAKSLGVELPTSVGKLQLRRDLVLAKREANRLAGIWGQKLVEAANDPRNLANPVAPATESMVHRYTIVTEIQATDSWNAERHLAAKLVDVEGKVLVKVWSAMGERHTCGICRGLDSRSILATDHWPLGDPGTVHPHCRCDEVYELAERWLFDRYAA